jgi:hypothetical protein
MMDRWLVPQRTGTHADAFAAVGLADMVSSAGGRCRIEAKGSDFEVSVSPPLDDESADEMLNLGYRYLQPKGNDRVPEWIPASEVLDYQSETEKAKRYSAARQMAKATGGVLTEAAEQERPIEDWRLYQVLNALQGDGGPNRVITFARRDDAAWRSVVVEGLAALREGRPYDAPVNLDLVQLFNPQSAKGYARLKPDSTGRGDKTKDAWAEPFVEILRYRGYFRAACPFFLGSKAVRVLTPIPRNIDFRMYSDVVRDLRGATIFAASGPKLDSLATLELAEALIRKTPQYQQSYMMPADLVDGVSVVQYQSMGNAKAVTSIERLSVPGWFPLVTQGDAETWLGVLAEHRAGIRSLDDHISDEIGLILEYRRFLEVRGRPATGHLLDFLGGYGVFLIRKRGQNKWRHRQFSQRGLEVVLSNIPEYSKILTNPGFRAIADALRSATVSAQWRKRNKMEYREIRYEVLPDLRRKRLLPGTEPFMQALADFVASYNAESAKRLEGGKVKTGTGRVSAEEFAAFASLLDGCKDASTVGALLCAYATCRAPQEAEIVEAEDGNEDDNEETGNAEA